MDEMNWDFKERGRGAKARALGKMSVFEEENGGRRVWGVCE